MLISGGGIHSFLLDLPALDQTQCAGLSNPWYEFILLYGDGTANRGTYLPSGGGTVTIKHDYAAGNYSPRLFLTGNYGDGDDDPSVVGYDPPDITISTSSGSSAAAIRARND